MSDLGELIELELRQTAYRKALAELSGRPQPESAHFTFAKAAPAADRDPIPASPDEWTARRTAVEKACDAIAAEMVAASAGKLTIEKAWAELLAAKPVLAEALFG